MMQSLSKTPLNIETARKIVASNLGSAASLTRFEELTEGFYNAAYLLEIDHRQKIVLKIAPPPAVRVLRYEKNILQAEVEALRLVKQQTQMPVPQVYFHDDSFSLLPSPYFAMEFISGEPLHKLRSTLTSEERAAIDRQTGVFLRQMNRIEGKNFGYYAQPDSRRPTWNEAFTLMLSGVLQDGEEAQVALPEPSQSILDLCRVHEHALDEVTTPCLVHWDLWDGNIFINPDRKQITGIIDFERCLWADPLMEVNFGAFGLNPDFFVGYGKELPLKPSEQVRRCLYNIYLYLIMVIECTYRQYPTSDQENWARGMLAQELEKLRQMA